MKWFDQWFARKCRWAWENRDTDSVAKLSNQAGLAVASVEESWGNGLRMNVQKIIGGYVVSFRTYDRRMDRSDERHYIITDEQEFERELGKMITLESMRQS